MRSVPATASLATTLPSLSASFHSKTSNLMEFLTTVEPPSVTSAVNLGALAIVLVPDAGSMLATPGASDSILTVSLALAPVRLDSPFAMLRSL